MVRTTTKKLKGKIYHLMAIASPHTKGMIKKLREKNPKYSILTTKEETLRGQNILVWATLKKYGYGVDWFGLRHMGYQVHVIDGREVF